VSAIKGVKNSSLTNHRYPLIRLRQGYGGQAQLRLGSPEVGLPSLRIPLPAGARGGWGGFSACSASLRLKNLVRKPNQIPASAGMTL